MKHYGDITKINGTAVEPVNVIVKTFQWRASKKALNTLITAMPKQRGAVYSWNSYGL